MAKSSFTKQITRWLDNWIVPVAFGVLSVLIFVQLIGVIPSVRSAFDRAEGRFAAIPTSAEPSAVKDMSGPITLMLDAPAQASHILVFRNGVSLGAFTTNQMDILLHDGDTITFRDATPNGPKVAIYVTSSQDPNMLLPAPGETVWVGSGVSTASLGKTAFM